MVDTIKFSEFLDGGDLSNNETTVGLGTGANTKFNNPWTFLAPGTTGERPAPVAGIYYRLRFNTTLEVYEYYDPTSATWTQLSGTGTGTVNPGSANDLAYYAVSGQIISPINGANSSVLVTDVSGLPSLSTTLPTGLTIPGATITGSTAALLSGSIVAAPVSGNDLVNKTYVDAQVGGAVLSITGTANQVIASSPTGNVTLSLPQNISTGSTPTFQGLTLTTTPLGFSSGGTNRTSLPSTAVASSYSAWDSNSNLSANNFLGGFATTVSAAGTTILTVASAYNQEVTGSTTQTLQMPVTSTLVTGFSFKIMNNSSGNVTLTSSGGNTILVMAANTTALVTCVLASGTTAASWNASYVFDNGAGVLSITGTANQVIASASTGAVTLSTPQDIATTSNVQFNSVRLSSAGLLDANNNTILALNGIASAVNYPQIANNTTTNDVFYGADGSDTNVGVRIQSKGTGIVTVQSTAPTLPFQIYSGTGNQHLTTFNFSNTNAVRNVTFQDASGTVAYLTDITTGSLNLLCQGRLTLTTNVPVTTSDVTAATTLYFTPYKGNQISLYDGSTTWNTRALTQISIAVPATTNTMYDVFCYDNAGTPTLELTAWTNDTTRATALAFQDGIYVKSGVTTRRYLGSFRTTGSSGQTEDSVIKRYVWNYYNRVLRAMSVIDTTDSWNYTLAAFRQSNANAANQLDLVIGVSEDSVFAQAYSMAFNASAGVNVSAGIGIDSTTVNSAQTRPSSGILSGGKASIVMATYNGLIAEGRHYLPWLEYSQASGTTTWLGDGGGALRQTGITGSILA